MKYAISSTWGAELCQAHGIPLETLRAWERHQVEPTEVELAYLRLIEREPEMAKLQVAVPAN